MKESHLSCSACFIQLMSVCLVKSMFNVVGLCCRPAASYISPA